MDEIADYLRKMAALSNRTSDECPHCGNRVVTLEQVGRCVYAYPCGCRQYQGRVPKAWQTGKETDEDEGWD